MVFDSTALTRHIERELAVLHTFIELLRAEQTALVRGETDQVAACVEPKSRHTLELTRLNEERGRWLASVGCSADRSGMEDALREQARGAAPLNKVWRELLQLAETARQLNVINGKLIATRLHNTQHALSALFSAARLPGAYGADGGTVSLRTTQQLAVA